MENARCCNAKIARVGYPLFSGHDKDTTCMHTSVAAQYESEADRHWDQFYKVNQRRFFKDRHYLQREFPVLLQTGMVMLELGCGVGNTSFPIAQANPTFQHIYSCDYSATAIQLLMSSSQFQRERMTAFIADITSADLSQHVKHSVDVVTCIFVLSANAPEALPNVVRSLKTLLRARTGTVVVRDYAAGDLAEQRLSSHGSQRKLADNFYIRGDGTRCYYFTQESLCQPFVEEGLVCRDVHVHSRVVLNRKTGSRMRRRWIQAVFCMPPGPPEIQISPRGPLDEMDSDANDNVDGGNGRSGCNSAVPMVVADLLSSVATWPSPDLGLDGGLDGPTVSVQVRSKLFDILDASLAEEELIAAQWLATHPSIQDKYILDVGSGTSGICGLAALGACAAYVLLCPDPAYLQLLRASLQLNASRVVCERLRLVSEQQLCSVLSRSPCGVFDCLVLRTPATSKQCLSLARALLVPGGLLLVLTQRIHDWGTTFAGMEIMMHDQGVVCVRL
eukprot:jgi/Ulvmu1/5130/UM021_0147.1